MEISLHAKTRGILERYRLRAKKELSQNFLINQTILDKILDAVDSRPGDSILEVGGGLGILTEALAQSGEKMICLEVDSALFEILTDRLKTYPNLTILRESILKFSPEKYFSAPGIKGIGNLPYHLSGKILRWFLDNRGWFSSLCFMLQKEVAERIVSPPGSKAYGVLSILSQHFTTPSILFPVPKDSFLPAPKVESAFITMIPKPVSADESGILVELVKHAFAQRRKTLWNNLKGWKILSPDDWKELLARAQIDEKVRAEDIPVETYQALAAQVRP